MQMKRNYFFRSFVRSYRRRLILRRATFAECAEN